MSIVSFETFNPIIVRFKPVDCLDCDELESDDTANDFCNGLTTISTDEGELLKIPSSTTSTNFKWVILLTIFLSNKASLVVVILLKEECNGIVVFDE